MPRELATEPARSAQPGGISQEPEAWIACRAASPGTSGGRYILRRFRFVLGLLFIGFLVTRLLFVGLGGRLLIVRLRLVSFLLGGLFFLCQQGLLFFFEVGAIGDIAIAIEVHAPIDQRFLHDGVGAQRIVIVDRQVRVLANVDRADTFVDAQLHRRIDSYQPQRFVVRQPAILHTLRSFLIQMRSFLGVIGVD